MYNNPPFWKQTLKNFRPRRLRRLDTSAFGALLLLNFTSNDATGGMTYICVCIHDVVSYMMAWAQSEVPLWWSESRVYYPSYILVNHVANYIQKHVPRNLENVNNNCARNSRVRSQCPLPRHMSLMEKTPLTSWWRDLLFASWLCIYFHQAIHYRRERYVNTAGYHRRIIQLSTRRATVHLLMCTSYATLCNLNATSIPN